MAKQLYTQKGEKIRTHTHIQTSIPNQKIEKNKQKKKKNTTSRVVLAPTTTTTFQSSSHNITPTNHLPLTITPNHHLHLTSINTNNHHDLHL
jgi:hypothetical protein